MQPLIKTLAHDFRGAGAIEMSVVPKKFIVVPIVFYAGLVFIILSYVALGYGIDMKEKSARQIADEASQIQTNILLASAKINELDEQKKKAEAVRNWVLNIPPVEPFLSGLMYAIPPKVSLGVLALTQASQLDSKQYTLDLHLKGSPQDANVAFQDIGQIISLLGWRPLTGQQSPAEGGIRYSPVLLWQGKKDQTSLPPEFVEELLKKNSPQ
jgi:hypothetical protein